MKLRINLDTKPNVGDVLTDLEYSGTTVTCLENTPFYLFSLEGEYNKKYLTPGTILFKSASKHIEGKQDFPNDNVQFKIIK